MNDFGKKFLITLLMYTPVGCTVSYTLSEMFWTATIINIIIFYSTFKFIAAVWD